jgi:ribosomal protein S27AE
MKAELIKLAAEMAMCQCMPSTNIEDWDLPKTTPVAAKRKIEASACLAEDQCKSWAIRLRQIVDGMDEADNAISIDDMDVDRWVDRVRKNGRTCSNCGTHLVSTYENHCWFCGKPIHGPTT